MVFDKLRKAFSSKPSSDEEYLEIDVEQEQKDHKVLIKLYMLRVYDDINEILAALREGYTITLIDIKVLRQKDPLELKRAISKIKKTVDALDGSVAGFGDNVIIATPSFARIHKDIPKPRDDQQKRSKFDY
ncbi:MAG: cell division protein SepF [Nanoarchaeota archaeon]